MLEKTYNKTSKVSNQSVHPPSVATILVYPSLDSLEAVEGTCEHEDSDQTADAQADWSVCWLHTSYCRFCQALAQI